MVTEADPIIGNWYQNLEKGQRFCVVAVDEETQLIEVQHFDGDLEEIERAVWYQMNLETTDEPENWAGALDVGELDDLGTSVTDTGPGDWNAPLIEITGRDLDKPATQEEEFVDDWGEGVREEEFLEERSLEQ